jgi:hypothetical protein
LETAVKIAIDPYVFRSTPLNELPGLVAGEIKKNTSSW